MCTFSLSKHWYGDCKLPIYVKGADPHYIVTRLINQCDLWYDGNVCEESKQTPTLDIETEAKTKVRGVCPACTAAEKAAQEACFKKVVDRFPRTGTPVPKQKNLVNEVGDRARDGESRKKRARERRYRESERSCVLQ